MSRRPILMVRGYPRPWIALVGRPNVGKSTLFNRLLGKRKAVVSSIRGTTRDRLYGQAEWRGRELTLIDTGGFDFATGDRLEQAIQRHIRHAAQEADAVMLICDGQEGVVPADEMILASLRTIGKPLLLVVNKTDNQLVPPPDFFALGVSDICAVSALHGRGIGDLLDRVMARVVVPTPSGPTDRGAVLAVAIVGRPNVGKSSLLNALLREERAIVSESPGTTRDAIDTSLTIEGEPLVLIDTAGLRQRRKVKSPVEFFAMSRTMEAIERCHIALVVLDATQGITQDDQRIVTHVANAGRGLILLVNKWDLVKGDAGQRLTEMIRRRLPSAASAPVLAVSAKTGFQVAKSMAMAQRLFRAMQHGLSEAECRGLIEETWKAHPVPRLRGRPVRLHRARWVPGRPSSIELFVSPGGRLPTPFAQYLLKRLQAHPKLAGVPLRLVTKAPREM